MARQISLAANTYTRLMAASAFPGAPREHQSGATGLVPPARHRLPLRPHQAHAPGAGLRFSKADNPGSDMESSLPARTPFRFRHAQVTVRSAARKRNVGALAGIYYLG